MLAEMKSGGKLPLLARNFHHELFSVLWLPPASLQKLNEQILSWQLSKS
jgi:hypothetical protein